MVYHCDSTVWGNTASKMRRIAVITTTGLPLALCLIMMAFSPVDCCRTGINRATDEAAYTAQVARREASHMGQVLRESVEILRADMNTALDNIDQQVGQVGRYVTQELGPAVEDAMIKFIENSQDVVFMIESSLNKVNSAIDETVSKTSMLVDLLIALVLLFIGAFCRITRNGDRFLKPVCWLLEIASFITAAALAVPVIFRIFTGHEPANYHMFNTVVVILLFLIIVHVSSALLSVLYNFCKERVTPVDVLTLAPFLWLRRYTGCSYKRLFIYILLSLFLVMATMWLVRSALTNVITASLLTCSVLLLVALASKGGLNHALLVYVPLVFITR